MSKKSKQRRERRRLTMEGTQIKKRIGEIDAELDNLDEPVMPTRITFPGEGATPSDNVVSGLRTDFLRVPQKKIIDGDVVPPPGMDPELARKSPALALSMGGTVGGKRLDELLSMRVAGSTGQVDEALLGHPGDLDPDLHKRILQMYFGLLPRVMGCADGKFPCMVIADGDGMKDAPSSRESALRCFRALREASIIEVTAEQYYSIYEAAARDSTEQAGVKYTMDPNDVPPEAEIKQYMDFMQGPIVKRMPHPTRLPFDTTFFAVDPWCAMPPLVRALWYGSESRWAVPFGLVVTRDEVFELSLGDSSAAGMKQHPDRDLLPYSMVVWSAYRSASSGGTGIWTYPLGMAPWITMGLVQMVNSVGSFLLQKPRSLWSSERARKARRVMKLDQLPPPAYYCVEIKPQTRTEASRMDSPFPALVVERDYQWMVRGNEKRRLMRGRLDELTPELEKWLLKRRAGGQRYHIVRAGQMIDPVTAEVLAYKGEPPPRPGEFVAALRWWQSAHPRGPKDKPLRPSTRRVRGAALQRRRA